MKKYFVFLFLLIFLLLTENFAQQITPSQFAHTYSIVARDEQTGEIGVAVQTHWFNVGMRVSWAEAGVGAIATQSFTNASFGSLGLELLRQGKSSQEVVDELIASDDGRDFRQLAVIDKKGNAAAYTGKKCIQPAGHIVGENFSVQANLMLNDKVWPAMAEAFKNTKGSLSERMMATLEAGQNAGGDIRGKQSAAMIIVKGESSGKKWEDEVLHLRIADHPEPIKEMRRLLNVQNAYTHMNIGDEAIEKNDFESAEKEYSAAMEIYPENLEIKYWYAVALANAGKVEESLSLFKDVFSKDENWRTLTKRLPDSDLLKVSNEDLNKIISLK
ncbi:MAG: Zn-dependent protease [Ignavibacteria bacterium GWB2_35_6b]|nr:MAG: Zn-dependent protease [Ignavibacteria bacterium GWB2_35_6b]